VGGGAEAEAGGAVQLGAEQPEPAIHSIPATTAAAPAPGRIPRSAGLGTSRRRSGSGALVATSRH
jgi:hypothetical protein